ncbi:MAG TPA: MBG domain-containing protein [Puia sp.]|uniref:beta strand repeat-containing protein n=1 Tax=Puia sp. TaxID=2045100 RepID=UPI002C41825F|nr:MBG domain-containing protein [Puia sp.]HVU96306.1 MBG domain-containing protein [Puia sp.]
MPKKALLILTLLSIIGNLLYGQGTLTISPGTVPDGTYRSVYPTQTLSASGGGTGPFLFSLSAGVLPQGITLSADGTLAGTPTAPGSYPFTVSVLDASTLNTGTQDYSVTVSPAPLTITPVSVHKAYGAAMPAFTFEYIGFVSGEGPDNLTSPPTANTTATAASPVGPYNITASGAASANYAISYGTGTLTIDQVPLTVAAVSVHKAYGAQLPTFTANYAGFVNGDDASKLSTPVSFSTTATAASPVAQYPITPSGATDPNYNISFTQGTLTIDQVTLTITANNATMTYGGAVPTPLTVSYSGFVNGDDVSKMSTPATATTSATSASPVNSYPITPGGAVDNNYTFNYVNGTLSIGKANLTITANPASSVYGAALVSNGSLTVNYSGFVNGDGPGSLDALPTVANSAVAGSPAGNYILTPSGASSNNYNFTYVTGQYKITPATLTVTANNQSMTYGGTVPTPLTVSYSGFVNGDDATKLSTPATATTSATSASPVNTYPITPGGAVSNNYTFNYVNGTLSIGKATLTITANPAGSIYGDPLVPNGSLTVSYSGFVNGDGSGSLTTQPTVSNTAVAGSPAGNYVLTPSGASSNNYDFKYVNGVYTVSKAPLSITANNQTMTYGGTVPTLTASYSGFVNGDDATRLTTPPNITTAVNSATAAGTYPISISGAVDPNYTITYTQGTITIGKATLTVTADDKSMTLGGPLPALTVSYAGFVNGDNATKLTSPATASTTATATSPAGTYPITPAGGSATNYTFNYVNGTLTIGRAVLTITANPAGSVYGAPLAAGSSLTVSYSGFVNGDGPGSLSSLPTVTNTAFSGAPAGAYTLTPSGASSSNYTINYVNGTYTISPASLNIATISQSMIYGGTVPPLAVTYSGFVNGDNPASLTTPPVVATSASSSSPVGGYPITASGARDPNYTISYTPGTLTIGKATLTVTADNKTMPLGGPLPTLTISYSGFVNGDGPGNLAQQPSLSVPASASSPAGAYPISVSGAVSSNYTFVYVTGILAVGKALLTITANPAGSVYGAPLAPGSLLTVTYSGFVNGDGPANLTTQPTVTNTAVTGAPVGTYALIPSGASSDNYAIAYVNGTYTISPAPLTITAANQTMTYGGAVPALTVLYSGFVNGDNASRLTTPPTLTTPAAVSSPVGTYPITASGAVDPNYTIAYNPGTMTIGKATLTVTPNPASMVYGGNLPALTASYIGFANGDKPGDLSAVPTLVTTATATSPAGAYPITASGGASSNYDFVYNPGTLTIGPAALHITALPQTKPFGQPDPLFTYTVTGLLNGDNTSVFTGSLSRTPGENVGTYAINTGSLSAGGNYTLDFTANNLIITIATQQIIWGQSLIVGCSDQTQVQLTAVASSGLPVTYSVADPAIASLSGSLLTLLKPGSTIVTATQPGDANHTAATPVNDTVYYQAASLIRQRWNDAIFFDNSGGDYVGWQWYKDGDAVPGATSPYYSETSPLNGQYYVIATNKDSQRVQSCVLSITAGAPIPGGIKVYPNPANTGAMVTVTSNYTSTALQGAVLTIVDLNGRVRTQVTAVTPTLQVAMPSETGTYIINLLLASGQKASVNVLVVQQ